MRPFINVFGKSLPAYGLMLVAAGAAAWLAVIALSKIKKRPGGDASLVCLIGISGGLIGAYMLRPLMKLIEVAVSWEKYKAVPAGELLSYMTGEIVFYGGLLGGMAAVVIFCVKFKIKLVPMFDLGAAALTLAHAIGRVGCFLGGCCYGVEVPAGHPLSVVYPPASLGAPPGVPLLAAPLIESAFLLVLFAALTVIYLKSDRDGLCSSVYLLVYPAGRFILEFFRGDLIRGSYGWFTTSQFISIGIFIFGVIYLIRATTPSATWN